MKLNSNQAANRLKDPASTTTSEPVRERATRNPGHARNRRNRCALMGGRAVRGTRRVRLYHSRADSCVRAWTSEGAGSTQ